MSNKGHIQIGPIGWTIFGDFWEERENFNVVEIFVSSGNAVNSLQFMHEVEGVLVLSDRHGKNSGSNFNIVKFDYPREYITSISGSYEHYYVTSIAFRTNLRTYGPFGDLRGDGFEFELGNEGECIGFCGFADHTGIRSIGAFIDPFRTRKLIKVLHYNDEEVEFL